MTSFSEQKGENSKVLHTLRFGLPTNAHVFELTDKSQSLGIVNFEKKVTKGTFRKFG